MQQPVPRHRMPSALCWLALTAVLGVLPACQKAGDSAAEAAMKDSTGKEVEIKRDGDAMTIEAGDAEIKIATAEDGGSVALPADFPNDVFLPSRRMVNSAMDMAGMKMVNVTTPANPAAVASDVEKAMLTRGWQREMAMQADGSSTLIFSKAQRQAAYQIMPAEGGGTQLAVRAGGN